jgi:hypothetical protein
VACPSEAVCCLYAVYPLHLYAPSGGLLLAAMSGSCKPSVFELQLMHLAMQVTGKFMKNWGFHFLPTTPVH